MAQEGNYVIFRNIIGIPTILGGAAPSFLGTIIAEICHLYDIVKHVYPYASLHASWGKSYSVLTSAWFVCGDTDAVHA